MFLFQFYRTVSWGSSVVFELNGYLKSIYLWDVDLFATAVTECLFIGYSMDSMPSTWKPPRDQTNYAMVGTAGWPCQPLIVIMYLLKQIWWVISKLLIAVPIEQFALAICSGNNPYILFFHLTVLITIVTKTEREVSPLGKQTAIKTWQRVLHTRHVQLFSSEFVS